MFDKTQTTCSLIMKSGAFMSYFTWILEENFNVYMLKDE